ncbi:hypothetical protein JS756_18945 [Streptomyces actuosus]|uniref:Uncharacterized protein n=1 Tax=Streptomyces actuosus TaxID=1885 RepID=A0ABS2VSX2_STRAS|nr:hypothetical protein [Streptomyces actuosus]MBN0046145.1 hypothetical protein [Streptomyces actuosus]
MDGRADSDSAPETPRDLGPEDAEDPEEQHSADRTPRAAPESAEPGEPAGPGERVEDARRARWTAAGTGALLALAGVAAALMRLTGTAPVLVPAAYALGAAGCGCAAVLGSRGRTRRALWLMIAGVMVMALGDQFD